MRKINSDDLAGLGVVLLVIQEAIAKKQDIPFATIEKFADPMNDGFKLIDELSKPKKKKKKKKKFKKYKTACPFCDSFDFERELAFEMEEKRMFRRAKCRECAKVFWEVYSPSDAFE